MPSKKEREETSLQLALHFRDTNKNPDERLSYQEWQEIIQDCWLEPEAVQEIYERFEYLQKDMEENPGEYHRWEIQNNPKYFTRFHDLQREMSWRDQKQQVERPELSFITQDEIDAVLRRGGITAGGRNRIYEYFMEHHDTKETAEFLKNEYGTGGSSPGIIGAYQSDASHDAKGLRLSKGKIGNPDVTVLLKWNKVAERVRQLVRSDDYLSPEEMEKYEERQEHNVWLIWKKHSRLLLQRAIWKVRRKNLSMKRRNRKIPQNQKRHMAKQKKMSFRHHREN